ncbi:protein of unknown function DUF664 [Beutenbergia cavernae DSM 12333]|uniref:Mini-circle protein n=1 Tax=Beutenbergia cavernae (strain ATCC BAA-8 / DSM 12333 / CCUG 43141 / JCM 11478 / NBRC 16432 / NCIMB 13614 / HKI 0122) TaxID=471853 RepID=C5BYP4_BEUC1|nr:DUF664 domain-containing protein [Beutenbergia cavernae]ACQ79002.1 protein of unknown function DUF664 [Beutenbergia cavernae DSM 12333]
MTHEATSGAAAAGTTDDTRIHEPELTAGETETLVFGLDRTRAQFAWKTGGLDAAALRRPFPPSTMTLGGLLKHLAFIESLHAAEALTGRSPGEPWESVDWDANPGWDWESAADDSPEELYALWHGAVAGARTALAAVVADGGLDARWKFTMSGGEPPNVRRYLVDMHEEYARHVGHADLFREAIDGLVGEDPPQPA